MTAGTNTESIYSISPDTLVTMTTIEENYWSHIMGNINLQHTFKNGQVLSANLDYLTYKNSNPTWYTTDYFSESNDLVKAEEIRISKDTPIDIWVADLTHSLNIGKSVTVDSGIKGTFSNLTNRVIYDEQMDSEWIVNPNYTSNALLEEGILAAFSTAKIVFDKRPHSMQASGTRIPKQT